MLPPVVRVFVALDAVDMRKSFDGLAAAVQSRMNLDPLSGHLYVFLNHRRNLMKMLFFDRTGYCILYKAIEMGMDWWKTDSRLCSRAQLAEPIPAPRGQIEAMEERMALLEAAMQQVHA